MRSLVSLASLLVATLAVAAEPLDPALGKELGTTLAWRLGPQAVELKCRDMDSAGADARKAALATWQRKNARLADSVDARVADVLPLIDPSVSKEDAIKTVRAQVTTILLEGLTLEACQSLANPAHSLWTNNGMPHVQQALAALYDWQFTHERRKE